MPVAVRVVVVVAVAAHPGQPVSVGAVESTGTITFVTTQHDNVIIGGAGCGVSIPGVANLQRGWRAIHATLEQSAGAGLRGMLLLLLTRTPRCRRGGVVRGAGSRGCVFIIPDSNPGQRRVVFVVVRG